MFEEFFAEAMAMSKEDFLAEIKRHEKGDVAQMLRQASEILEIYAIIETSQTNVKEIGNEKV